MHYCRQTKQLLAKHQFIVISQFVFYSYLIRICSYLFVKNTNEYERIRTEYELFTNRSNHLSTPNRALITKTTSYAKETLLVARSGSHEDENGGHSHAICKSQQRLKPQFRYCFDNNAQSVLIIERTIIATVIEVYAHVSLCLVDENASSAPTEH